MDELVKLLKQYQIKDLHVHGWGDGKWDVEVVNRSLYVGCSIPMFDLELALKEALKDLVSPGAARR